jgi:hypothetical protein
MSHQTIKGFVSSLIHRAGKQAFPFQVVGLLSILCISCPRLHSQSEVNWDEQYTMQLSDFKSDLTKIGETNFISLQTAATLYFSFQMSTAEFMFTKNFNSKVSCYFLPGSAYLVAPDSNTARSMVDYANFEFDLAELYARRLRQRLYEEKGAFSDVNFFKPEYDEVFRQLNERKTHAIGLADFGRNKEKLKELHDEVLKELTLLADFCKSCKVKKKKNP